MEGMEKKMKIINALIFLIVINVICISAVQVIDVNVPQETVESGDQVYVNVDINNFEDFVRRDDYVMGLVVLDNDKIILEKNKTIAIDNHVKTTISFILPEDIKEGQYIVKVSIGEVESTTYFTVVLNEEEKFDVFYLFEILVILNLIWILFFLYKKIKKK